MDFATITNNANSIIKTGGSAGGDTSAYKGLEPVDSQREIIVSHLKSEYSNKTIQAINAKELFFFPVFTQILPAI